MKAGLSLTQLAAEIERRANAKVDYVAPVGKLEMVVADGKPAIAVAGRDLVTFPTNKIADGQIAEFAGIPKAYYDRMRADDPRLLALNVNRWFKDHQDKGTRRMVRTLDGQNRAFLSDAYRKMENEDLAEAVLPVLLDMDLMILSCQITDYRMYLKCVARSIERDVPVGYAIGDGSHKFFDTFSPGLTIATSEVGHGRLSIQSTIYTRMCTNLADMGSVFKTAHLGTRADISEEVLPMLTDNTKKLADAALWAQVKDVVRGAFDEVRFEAQVKRLSDAGKVAIPASDVVEVVERVGKKFSLLEVERKAVVARLIESANLSQYGLHAAVTRAAQDVEDYDRATELERIGGMIIDVPAKEIVSA